MQDSRLPRGAQSLHELSAADQMRRFGECLIAGMLLLFTLPLMIVVAAAIEFENPGPVFERQERIGPGGKRFQIISFRTTVQRQGPLRSTWQITQVGQFLRRTRIDALPQLFNVLRGDMSIIDTAMFD